MEIFDMSQIDIIDNIGPIYSTCPICGVYFPKRDTNQKYCSKKCKNSMSGKKQNPGNIKNISKEKKAIKEKATCPICGKEFLKSTVNQKYCNKGCSYEAFKMQQRNKKKKIHPEQICPVCNKSFSKEFKNQRYCSKECSHEASIIKQNAYNKEHAEDLSITKKKQRKKNKSEGLCVYCSKSALPGLTYCSACASKHKNYVKQRYYKNKALGLCTACGKPARIDRIYCEECAKKHN